VIEWLVYRHSERDFMARTMENSSGYGVVGVGKPWNYFTELSGTNSGKRSRLVRINDWPEKARSDGVRYRALALAKQCSISPSQLRRFFLENFGKTPQDWMDELRMAKAADLLIHSNKSVKEIAVELHFNYPGNFCRQFKRIYGRAPSEYVMSHNIQRQKNIGKDSYHD